MKKMRQLIPLCCLLFLISCNSDKSKKETTNVTKKEPSELKKSMAKGRILYQEFCKVCHMPTGKGVERVFPPLADSDYLRDNQIESIKSIKYGLSGKITVNGIEYNSNMVSLGLEDDEIAHIMNYINNTWGNKYSHFLTAEEISKINK